METTEWRFTLEEAQALVPWLQETFDAIEPLTHQFARAKRKVQQLSVTMRSNGVVQVQEQFELAQQDLQVAEDAIVEHTDAIAERGIILRSVERGLVDFPAMRDGRIVYLCWLAGENEIKHWHDVDVGFDSRRPL
jgi:hypothetical protein